MSTRNTGMVGKTYTSASEAFKDASWSIAIERPTESRFEEFWGLLGALLFVATFGYIIWQGINHI